MSERLTLSFVNLDNFGGSAGHLDDTVGQPNATISKFHYGFKLVRNEQYCSALITELSDTVETLLLEVLIANCEHLVYDQDVGINVNSDRKTKPSHHATRKSANRCFNCITELAEFDDAGKSISHFIA